MKHQQPTSAISKDNPYRYDQAAPMVKVLAGFSFPKMLSTYPRYKTQPWSNRLVPLPRWRKNPNPKTSKNVDVSLTTPLQPCLNLFTIPVHGGHVATYLKLQPFNLQLLIFPSQALHIRLGNIRCTARELCLKAHLLQKLLPVVAMVKIMLKIMVNPW